MSSDRLALVTGTSTGIGLSVARALLRDGWSVIGMSRRPADIADAGYRHVSVDLSDLAALKTTAEGNLAPLLRDPAVRRAGLVNNAAAVGSSRPVEETDPLALARAYALNTVAPVFLMGFAVRVTAPAVPLRIVNVSTGAAHHALPGAGDYCGSKAALRMAGMVLAEELQSAERPGGPRPNAAVLSYEPGVVDTPMQVAARAPGRLWNRMFVDFHEQGRLVPPEGPAEEIARFLAEDGGEPFAERRYGMST